MPLRAIRYGADVIAPHLSDEAWAALRKDRAGIALPCCGSGIVPKVSSRGLRFFAHRARKTEDRHCDWKPESEVHLGAKLAILAGCEDAGWTARPEMGAEDGTWRADVLATQVTAGGEQRVAFEVQWSRQSLEETRSRQERYASAGIRGCWFLRPSGRGESAIMDRHFMTCDKTLPVFALQAETPDAPIVLQSDGWRLSRPLPLRDFIQRLLTRRVRFSHEAVQNVPCDVTMEFLRCDCWRCGAEAHFYHVEGHPTSACGLSIGDEYDWADRALHSSMIQAARAFVQTPAGGSVRLGAIKRRYSKTVGGSYISFVCPKCDALFGRHFLFEHVAEATYARGLAQGSVRTVVQLPPTLEVEEHPHWCMPDVGPHCSARRA